MMRQLLLALCSLTAISAHAQVKAPVANTEGMTEVVDIVHFTDSISRKLLADTVKFNPSDVVRTAIGKQNYNTYSPMFYVEMGHMYKLDIVPGDSVVAFIKTMLDPANIKNITVMNAARSQSIFGSNGQQGAILISLKRKVNFAVAGLQVTKQGAANFY